MNFLSQKLHRKNTDLAFKEKYVPMFQSLLLYQLQYKQLAINSYL